jgi:PII-like signaling protein
VIDHAAHIAVSRRGGRKPVHPFAAHGRRSRSAAAPDAARAGTRLHGPASRLTIFIGEASRFNHRPLYDEIVRRAHEAGLAGATVLRGIEGYGASTHVHTMHLLSSGEDLPAIVLIVDDAERIRAFLPELDGLVDEGMVVFDDVEVIKYVGRRQDSAQVRHPGVEESHP